MTGRRSHGRLSALNGVVHQGIEDAAIVDHHVIADPDLVRVSQRDVRAEDHVAAALGEKQWVELRSQKQPEGAGDATGEGDDRFVPEEATPAGSPDHEVLILLPFASRSVKDLTRDVVDLSLHGPGL